MAGGGIKINNTKIVGGADGATFVPSYNEETGELSWSNNKGYSNPASAKIKGADGKDGETGPTGAKIVSQVLQGQDANGGNIYLQTFDDGTTAIFVAPKGEKGEQGEKGEKGETTVIVQEKGNNTNYVMSQKAVSYNLDKIERDVNNLYAITSQSGLYSIIEIEQEFSSRITATGENIVDGATTKVQMIKGKTVVTDSGLKHTNFKSIKSTGKQLIPFPYAVNSGNANGIDYSVLSNGEIVVNGTATADFGRAFTELFSLPAGTYTLSGCPSGGSYNSYYLQIDYTVNGVYNYKADLSNGVTFTIDSFAESCRIRLYIRKDKTVDNLIFSPMLNFGNTAQPFEPYKVEEYGDGNSYELAEYDYIYPQIGNIARQTGYATSETGFTEEEIATYNEPIVSVDNKSLEYKLENPIIQLIDYPKGYTANNGGGETVEQGNVDNSEFDANCTIKNEYFKITTTTEE